MPLPLSSGDGDADVGQHLLELARLVRRHRVVAASHEVAPDKDLGNCPHTVRLIEDLAELGAVAEAVKVHDRRIDAEVGEQLPHHGAKGAAWSDGTLDVMAFKWAQGEARRDTEGSHDIVPDFGRNVCSDRDCAIAETASEVALRQHQTGQFPQMRGSGQRDRTSSS